MVQGGNWELTPPVALPSAGLPERGLSVSTGAECPKYTASKDTVGPGSSPHCTYWQILVCLEALAHRIRMV